MSENPLKQYFRTPAIHLDLPSKGEFYGDGAIEMPESGEVPVYPMTAIDEITYKTPDALFNGSAIVDVIKSCVPAIKDPWKMPVIDLTAILAAIRIASFGDDLEIETSCPKCDVSTDYTIKLQDVIESITTGDYNAPIQIGELEIFIQPLSYKKFNENNQTQFTEQQIANVVNSKELSDDERLKILSDAFREMSDFTLSSLSDSIKCIKTPDSVVTDKEHILEFLSEAEGTFFEELRKKIAAVKKTEQLKPFMVVCQEEKCGHEYEQPFTLDMTSFFDRDSLS